MRRVLVVLFWIVLLFGSNAFGQVWNWLAVAAFALTSSATFGHVLAARPYAGTKAGPSSNQPSSRQRTREDATRIPLDTNGQSRGLPLVIQVPRMRRRAWT